MKKVGIIIFIILVIIAVVFYLNKGNINTQTAQQSPDKTIQANGNTVYILNFNFAPEIIKIKKGDEVLWINQDQSIHDIKMDNLFVSPKMGIGESFLHIFDQMGEFDYTCGVHPVMKGKVIVE